MTTIELVCDGSLSGDEEMEILFAQQLKKQFELFARKQRSYGRGNIAMFQERGVLVRVSDKVQRLIRLVWKGVDNPLADETIEDTWMDLSVYCTIANICRQGKWI